MRTQRFALRLEYDGTQFYGWQDSQSGLRTVQSCLEHAIEAIAQHPIETVVAGRTDKGVHALGQVVHFDSSSSRSLDNWLMGINRYLPKDIVVQQINAVSCDFHARFSANYRHYQYTILNQKIRPVLDRHKSYWHYFPLDSDLMQHSSEYLIGEHDFNGFRDSECQSRTSIRKITHIAVVRHNQRITIDIIANAFLHHMVRNIVGCLLWVGMKKQPVSWIKSVLLSKDRRNAGPTVPAHGLTLVEVGYPSQCLITQF